MYMGIKLSKPSIISWKGRSTLWIMFSRSPFFSIMAMPNIHFFGNWESFDISVMGRSLYMVTGPVLWESTVALRKSSWASISSGSPV